MIARRVMAPGYGAVGPEPDISAPIRVGKGAFVGEASVLDLDTALGDFAELGHASSLQRGQRVPDGKRYHGSPAEETHDPLPPRRRIAHRRLAARPVHARPAVLALVVLGPLADAAATWALTLWVAGADSPRSPPRRVTPRWRCCRPRSGSRWRCLSASLVAGLAAIYGRSARAQPVPARGPALPALRLAPFPATQRQRLRQLRLFPSAVRRQRADRAATCASPA